MLNGNVTFPCPLGSKDAFGMQGSECAMILKNQSAEGAGDLGIIRDNKVGESEKRQ